MQGIGWQAIFYVNVPIAIVAFVILQRKVVNLPGPTTKVDWPGLVTSQRHLLLSSRRSAATTRAGQARVTSWLFSVA